MRNWWIERYVKEKEKEAEEMRKSQSNNRM
jgi:hypothetical protein